MVFVFAPQAVAESARENQRALAQFANSIQPLFKKYCFQCHGGDIQEADLRIDDLNANLVEGQHGGQWSEILDALNRGDMPPENEPQPSAQERDKIVNWLSSEINRAAVLRRSTGGQVTLRRLTRDQYNNTMRDLLGIEMNYAKELPPDTRGIDGYKNNGVYMEMSEQQLEEYYNAAKRGLRAAIARGDPIEPIYQIATESAKKVRFDSLALATFDKKLGATPVGYSMTKASKKKPSRPNETAMVLLCLDKLPLTGTFRVKIKASATKGDAHYSPPRMHIEIGHKTGAKVEPSKVLGERDITANHDSPQKFEFTGRLEEYPLHIGKTIKKFPGLRVIITDSNAVPPKIPSTKKGEPETPAILDNRPQLVVHSVEFETPIDKAWPPATHTQILPPRASDDNDGVYLRSVLTNFMTRAYRRTATQEEVDWAVRYYNKVRATTDTFESAMVEVLSLVLVSPKFLYLVEYESQQPNGKKVPLTDYELASRLSYFLWETMPDAELVSLAEEQTLNDELVLIRQVHRMLADKRSQEFTNGFASQWLNLDSVDAVAINPEYFPTFDSQLKEDMKQESRHFFATILKENRSCLELLDSDFVVINDRMADFYGLEKPKSGDFQKVKLPTDSVRGGVLSQASFLLANSTGEQSHPVYRARWFLDRILGDPAGDPPADVPEIDKKAASSQKLSLRQQLEEHRTRESCNRCHRRLDPWGIPFEEFDAVGQHIEAKSRLLKSGKANGVKEKVKLPDGTEVLGSKQLISYLLETKQEKFAEGFCRHMLTYALGRSLEWTDQPLVDQLAKDFKEDGYRMDKLITSVVLSEAFRMK